MPSTPPSTPVPGSSTAPPWIPAGAHFRRAVGLELRLSFCDGLEPVNVSARRHGGDSTKELTLEDASRLCHLNAWHTAAELGVPVAFLRGLVKDNLAYWSTPRPSQRLSGGALEELSGPVALRHNVWVTPVTRQDGAVGPIPFMPRRDSLNSASPFGVHLGVMEMGHQTLGVGVGCCTTHALVLRDLIPRLDGRCSAEDLSLDPRLLPALDLLFALDLLEQAPLQPSPAAAPRVTWMGHAAVLLELGGARLLVDPLFHPASQPHRQGEVQPPDPRLLGALGAVLITHGDNDHFNPQALYRVDRRTPVVIPGCRWSRPYHVDMERVLELLGFTDVRTVRPGQRVRVQDATVHVLPFHGEDWGLSLPTCTYVVQGGGATVVCGADSHGMGEVWDEVGQKFNVDLALLGVGGCQEAHVMPKGFGYGNFYAPWIHGLRRQQWVELCDGPQDAAEAARRLRARSAFGYAAGGAPFIALAYSDRGTHQDLATLLTAGGHPTRPLELPLGQPVPIPVGAASAPGA